jgi:hypothetical protein
MKQTWAEGLGVAEDKDARVVDLGLCKNTCESVVESRQVNAGFRHALTKAALSR